MEISRVGEERFLLTFNHEFDRKMVMEISPWTFDKFPIILVPVPEDTDPHTIPLTHCDFMVHAQGLPFTRRTRAMAEFIGNKIGIFRDVEFEHASRTRPDSLCIRIGISMSDPLKRSINITCPDGKVMEISFTYERLVNFCYLCGLCNHTERVCDLRYSESFVDPMPEFPFGDWLREASREKSLSGRRPQTAPQRPLQRRFNRAGVQADGLRRNFSSEFQRCGGSPVTLPPPVLSQPPPQRPSMFSGVQSSAPGNAPTALDQFFLGQLGQVSSPHYLGLTEAGPSTPNQQFIPGVGLAFNSAKEIIYSQAQIGNNNLSPLYHKEPITPYVPQYISQPILSQSMASNNTPSSVNKPNSSNIQQILISAPPTVNKKLQKRSHPMEIDGSPTPESKAPAALLSNSEPESSSTLNIICSPDDRQCRKISLLWT